MSEEKNEKLQTLKTESLEITEQTVPKYPKPKILLLDMKEETKSILEVAGYHIKVGSFGFQYKVNKSSSLQPAITNDTLPWDVIEQEIVVVDLLSNANSVLQLQETTISLGEYEVFASCNSGVIDPRPLSMVKNQKCFDKILAHGGVFVIFANQRQLQTYQIFRLGRYRGIDESDISCDNWSFLDILNSDNLETNYQPGQEISVIVEEPTLAQLLGEHVKGAGFVCTLNPTHRIRESWVTLAEDKYGLPVSAAIVPNSRRGWIFIFPHLRDKPHFLVRFFNEVLPDLSPHLFPYTEGSRWVQKPEYELPKVLELKSKIQQIQEDARRQVAELEEAIEKERAEKAYLYDLIRETGTALVTAVNKSLKILGFQSVINIDEEIEKVGNTQKKSEDLQIRDDSPILIVEVKGISGRIPKDDDVLAVQKYVVIRMREWGHTNVQGLEIINHERNIPALDRENKELFREELLINAQEQKIGLLTTWDLFRLTRSFLKKWMEG